MNMKLVLLTSAVGGAAASSSISRMMKRGANALQASVMPDDYEFQDLGITDHLKGDFIGGAGLWKEHAGKITIPQCANFGMYQNVQDEFVVVAEADDLEAMSSPHVRFEIRIEGQSKSRWVRYSELRAIWNSDSGYKQEFFAQAVADGFRFPPWEHLGGFYEVKTCDTAAAMEQWARFSQLFARYFDERKIARLISVLDSSLLDIHKVQAKPGELPDGAHLPKNTLHIGYVAKMYSEEAIRRSYPSGLLGTVGTAFHAIWSRLPRVLVDFRLYLNQRAWVYEFSLYDLQFLNFGFMDFVSISIPNCTFDWS